MDEYYTHEADIEDKLAEADRFEEEQEFMKEYMAGLMEETEGIEPDPTPVPADESDVNTKRIRKKMAS